MLTPPCTIARTLPLAAPAGTAATIELGVTSNAGTGAAAPSNATLSPPAGSKPPPRTVMMAPGAAARGSTSAIARLEIARVWKRELKSGASGTPWRSVMSLVRSST